MGMAARRELGAKLLRGLPGDLSPIYIYMYICTSILGGSSDVAAAFFSGLVTPFLALVLVTPVASWFLSPVISSA